MLLIGYLVITKGGNYQADAGAMYQADIQIGGFNGYFLFSLIFKIFSLWGTVPGLASILQCLLYAVSVVVLLRYLRNVIGIRIRFLAGFSVIFVLITIGFCWFDFIGYDGLSMIFAIFSVTFLHSWIYSGLKSNKSLIAAVVALFLFWESRPNTFLGAYFVIFVMMILFFKQSLNKSTDSEVKLNIVKRVNWKCVGQLTLKFVVPLIILNLLFQPFVAAVVSTNPPPPPLTDEQKAEAEKSREIAKEYTFEAGCLFLPPIDQAIARVFVDNDDVDLTDLDLFQRAFDQEGVRNHYHPYMADYVTYYGFKYPFSCTTSEFFHDFFTLGFRYPGSYINGYIDANHSMLIPFDVTCPYSSAKGEENHYNCQDSPGNTVFTAAKYYIWKGVLSNPGTYFWLCLVLTILCAFRKKYNRRDLIPLLMLALGVAASLMIAGYGTLNRYCIVLPPVGLVALLLYLAPRLKTPPSPTPPSS